MEVNYIETKPNMFHFEEWTPITNPLILKESFEHKLKLSGFNIVNFTEHHFPKKGYTCIWLLAESHLAIHTFPECNKSYVQLSSCNLEKRNEFERLLSI
ncbi:S-adenosylmethionine decarboxylase family protein [Tamlana sp. I1]|uniref:S-adenosylmethionine decarboxylase family protein n=1 Tax=Tamlana sp. I1 TaxID=2762061 RepID=UPI00188FC5BF|nr:S-adenosylmethionine decarboxylase [Tamlana sp. I1]